MQRAGVLIHRCSSGVLAAGTRRSPSFLVTWQPSMVRTRRQAYHTTAPALVGPLEEAFNQAFSFRPTPESLTPEALHARAATLPADLDFNLDPVFLRQSLQQHRKENVIALMRSLAGANKKAHDAVLTSVELFMRRMDAEMAEQQRTSTNAATVAAGLSKAGSSQETAPGVDGKMSLQEAVVHGQLSAEQLEGLLRDLHKEATLTPADENQIKQEACALCEAGTAAIMAVDHALPKQLTSMVLDKYPWADLLLADDVSQLIVKSPLSKIAARLRAAELLERHEKRKEMNWISRLTLPSVPLSKIRAGVTPHIYDAALDAAAYNELDQLLTSSTGVKLIEDTFRHVVNMFEQTPENIAHTVAGVLHTAFVDRFVHKMRSAGLDYHEEMTKAFSRKLLTQYKPLTPYFAQHKREQQGQVV